MSTLYTFKWILREVSFNWLSISECVHQLLFYHTTYVGYNGDPFWWNLFNGNSSSSTREYWALKHTNTVGPYKSKWRTFPSMTNINEAITKPQGLATRTLFTSKMAIIVQKYEFECSRCFLGHPVLVRQIRACFVAQCTQETLMNQLGNETGISKSGKSDKFNFKL